tara:strand:- start:249 stop:959 length:711 start_codon:yes stop_codon:yes gene_type:complete
MSDYTISVAWSGKDALADSDAAKVISGSDFNTEFTTVRTAINSKADLNGDATESFAIDDATIAGTLAITGVPTGPTQSAGNNTTRLATTAFVTTAVAAITAATINTLVYPVGSLYFNMAVSTNPNTLLGMGTWVAYATGQVLVGFESSGTFDALDESLGAETAAHTLTTAELPSHTHPIAVAIRDTSTIASNVIHDPSFGSGGVTTRNTNATGSGSAHSHSTLQPSVTVYIWKRTA